MMTEVGRRLSALAAPAVASALVFVGAGAADNSVTAPYENTALNECNGEEVLVEGSIHFENHSTTTANGTHVQFTINLADVKGVAVLPPTGARYVESDTDTGSSNMSSDFVPFEATHVETRILTRLGEDGTPDDLRYYLRFHMTVNANGVPTVDRTDSRMECK
jgi:hypothetical protein